jgi:hypothetical protein
MVTLLGKWLDWISFIMTGFGWSMCTRNVASISRLSTTMVCADGEEASRRI